MRDRAPRLSPLLIGSVVVLAGTLAALHYHRLGLSLAHFDARAHLVVARRILDSMVPGWQQIGAVWLPLPHLLNMIPVQVDGWYRSGASGIAISVLSMGTASWALTRILVRLTGSIVASVTGAALLMANPNVLYLQSTPMTEPLLIATSLLAIALTAEWVDAVSATGHRQNETGGRPPEPVGSYGTHLTRAGLAIVAACMTRYEAWPICGALIALAGLVLIRRGTSPGRALAACSRLALYPIVAIALFSANSRWTTGFWFVPPGFFVPENEAAGNISLAFAQVRESVYQLSGTAWVWPACAAAPLLVFSLLRSRRRASIVLVLALAATAAVPWYAYLEGHPVRVRYGLPLVVACAATAASGIGLLWSPVRPLVAAAVVGWALSQSALVDLTAPLVVESQRDVEKKEGRAAVTEYLRAHWDGSPIMMSMGSLAHYMHDLSALGLDIRDFLQEGNEQLWVHAATRGPRGLVRWVVIEEQGEGGDSLFHAARQDPQFLSGFERVAEGGGVALYRANR